MPTAAELLGPPKFLPEIFAERPFYGTLGAHGSRAGALQSRNSGLVRRQLRRPDGCPGSGLGRDRSRRALVDPGAHGIGQNARGVLVVSRSACDRAGAQQPQAALPGAVYLTAESAGTRRRS